MIVLAAWLMIFILALAIDACAQEIDTNVIIQIESGGDPNAVSFAGAKNGRGLMQISEIVLKEYNQVNKTNITVDSLYNPGFNKEVGTWYLLRIFNRYLKCNGTTEDILICYNWGYGNWRKWNKAGRQWGKLPTETQNYISKYKRIVDAKKE